MEIRAAEISAILKEQIANFGTEAEMLTFWVAVWALAALALTSAVAAKMMARIVWRMEVSQVADVNLARWRHKGT